MKGVRTESMNLMVLVVDSVVVVGFVVYYKDFGC